MRLAQRPPPGRPVVMRWLPQFVHTLQAARAQRGRHRARVKQRRAGPRAPAAVAAGDAVSGRAACCAALRCAVLRCPAGPGGCLPGPGRASIIASQQKWLSMLAGTTATAWSSSRPTGAASWCVGRLQRPKGLHGVERRQPPLSLAPQPWNLPHAVFLNARPGVPSLSPSHCSDNLSVLQAAVLGVDLRSHHRYAFAPGEARRLELAEGERPEPPTSFACPRPPQCV